MKHNVVTFIKWVLPLDNLMGRMNRRAKSQSMKCVSNWSNNSSS